MSVSWAAPYRGPKKEKGFPFSEGGQAVWIMTRPINVM
jgi:hypothetical protein